MGRKIVHEEGRTHIYNPDKHDVELGPRELDADNVVYYCKHSEEVSGSARGKAKKLVAHDCVQYMGKDKEEKYCWAVLPLNKDTTVTFKHQGRKYEATKRAYSKDYNKSTYVVRKERDGHLICNCQAYTTREKKGEIRRGEANCAHTLGLYFSWKIKQYNNKRISDEKQE